MKIIVSILIAIVIAFIGLVLLLFYGIPYSVTRELRKINCSGTIISMEEEAPCYMTIAVRQQIDTVKFDVGHCCGDNAFFEFTSIGDSVKKESGTLKLLVIKRNSAMIRGFDYPHCYQ